MNEMNELSKEEWNEELDAKSNAAQIQQNISLFKKLLLCGSNIYLWTYDPDGELVTTNCPELSLNQIFIRSQCRDMLVKHAATSRLPVTLSSVLGFYWGAAFEYDGDQLKYLRVIGPVLGAQYDSNELAKVFLQFDIPTSFRSRLLTIIANLPTVPTTQFFRLVLMLHCCLTGEQLNRMDIIPLVNEIDSSKTEAQDKLRNRSLVYKSEQALLNNVREGNRNYRRELEVAGQISTGVNLQSNTPSDQARISIIVFCSLCTRAAIEGGLSPETAYSLGDRYIQEASRAKSITNLQKIGDRMYDDFITRVHNLTELSDVSPQIRICMELMKENPEENITLADLALRVNYSEYYLSRLFKKETGMSVSEYSHKVRIGYAKGLLLTTDLPIYEIAARLHYSSSTHFSDRFNRIAGCYPQQYRDKNRK